MKKLILFSFILSLFLVSFVLASATEINYTTSSYDTSFSFPKYSGIQIEQLKYDPYPVTPGEYFDIYIKAQAIGDTVNNAIFELTPEFPFSLDSNENPIREYGDVSSEIVMKYKVRVSKDAVEGVNQLKLEYTTNGNEWAITDFDVQVDNSKTDFDLVIQDSTSSETSIAIANTGKNTANSLIVKIPEQQNFRVTGTNGQMVGNLNSGDYTVVSFSLAPTGMGSRSERNLTVQLDYTDLIGERRSVLKDIQVGPQTLSGFNMTGTTGQSYGNFAGGRTNAKKNNSFWYEWGVILILVILIFIIYKKYPKQTKNLFNKIKNKFRKKGFQEHSDKTPDWVLKEKEKKK